MPNVMTVSPSLPVKTAPEFIAYAKARPGKVNMGSAGVAIHLAGELFKMMTGVNMTHVPHRASSAMFVGLFAGQTQVAFDTLPPSMEYIRTKKLRALAVTTGKRSDALPEVPTIGDFIGIRGECLVWGWGAARYARRNHRRAEQGDQCRPCAPILKARFSDLGGSAFSSSPAEFGKFIADEMEKWAKVVKFAGMKPE
jgi:tripartite-type tricarboxylate transporter receptor subunit TctC